MDNEDCVYNGEQFYEDLVEGIQKNNAEMIKSNKKETEVENDRNNKRIIERHRFLYNELQHCTDIDTYNRLWKEYAELDIKVARITNKDLALKSRCEVENSFMVVK